MAADPGPLVKHAMARPTPAQIENLRQHQARALSGGGPALCAPHHERGKVLVRDRVDLLLDPESQCASTGSKSMPRPTLRTRTL